VWPFYHDGDEVCVNRMLKVCGRYVKHLSFPHRHGTPSKLVQLLEYCSNVTELYLPTTKLNPQQLGKVVKLMTCLQKLDTRQDDDIKQLIELVNVDLKELTIRIQKYKWRNNSIESWMNVWIFRKFVPQKINIIYMSSSCVEISDFMRSGLYCWETSNPQSPPGRSGQIKFYRSANLPLNLHPVLPVFQLDFGQTAVLPMVIMNGIGSGVFLVTDGIHHGKMVCRASMLVDKQQRHPKKIICCSLLYRYVFKHNCPSVFASTQFNNKFVTEFVCHSARHCVEVLEQVAITWPHLLRLSIHFDDYNCNLPGLRAIANSCQSLHGLKIWGGSHENQEHLWEILSDMKLTHLAVKLCVLLPPAESVPKLSVLFRKFTNLQALEAACKGFGECTECKSKFVNNDIMTILAHFQSLTHCIIYSIPYLRTLSTIIYDTLTSCKQLKCLILNDRNRQAIESLPSQCCSSLQQLYYSNVELSDRFLTTISAHGGLVDVVLCVNLVTSEGIFALVRNSPNLIAFRVSIQNSQNDFKINPEVLTMKLQKEFSHRTLFLMGSFTITTDQLGCEADHLEWEE